MMKKVITTGAGGFVGKALCRRFLEKGAMVYALVRNKKEIRDILDRPNIIVIEIDMENYQKIPELINDDVDVFFHLAWNGYGKATQEYSVQVKNIMYTCHAIEAAIAVGCKKFVFTGSSHQFLVKPVLINGKWVSKNCSIYGTAKSAAELMCKTIAHTKGIELCTTIFTNVFGVGDTSSRSTNTFIRMFMNGQITKLVKGDNLYDWTYIDDAINGLIAVGDYGKNDKQYYIGNSNLRPLKDIIAEVKNIVAPHINLVFGEYEDYSYIDYSKIDLNLTYQDTRYQAQCGFKESILKTMDWISSLKVLG